VRLARAREHRAKETVRVIALKLPEKMLEKVESGLIVDHLVALHQPGLPNPEDHPDLQQVAVENRVEQIVTDGAPDLVPVPLPDSRNQIQN
ncbi:MAG: hypothetical protein JKY10_03455, partial [Cohaesibacteraceae bacterium]|nr:hypothetical protein [Cohaesibacteraceae bacterium]